MRPEPHLLEAATVFLRWTDVLSTSGSEPNRAKNAGQDRVIRLEMRLRLKEVLSGDLRGRILELTPSQLIGLRFASDAELPDLVREVLANGIQDREVIKRKIRDWQADHLRA